ncbi:MAG: MurR/RpiR family transcriptional regulator [Paracoccaceae bacterium]
MSDRPAPKSVDEFRNRVRELSDDMPKRMRQCAEYLAANSDKIALSTVADLAASAHVQPSAIMRFCQMLGFSGFSQLQRLFRETVSQGFPDYSARLNNLRDNGAGSPSALLAEFTDAGRMSLENLIKTVDARVLDASVSTLANAQTIHIVGLRRSFPVASYLAYAFEKMAIPAMLHDGVGGMNATQAVREGDALIAITFAPYVEETVELVLNTVQRGIPVVAMTDTYVSPVNVDPVHALFISEVDFGAFRSLTGTLSLAISIAVAVGASRNS